MKGPLHSGDIVLPALSSRGFSYSETSQFYVDLRRVRWFTHTTGLGCYFVRMHAVLFSLLAHRVREMCPYAYARSRVSICMVWWTGVYTRLSRYSHFSV